MKKIITFLTAFLFLFSFHVLAAIPEEYADYVEEVNGQICVIEPHEDLALMDGVLFNKIDKVLLRYSEGKTDRSYSVPNGITAINEYAFVGNKYLEEITIPGSVKTIHDHAFYHCENLSAINLFEGLTSIGGYAFSACDNLESITIPDSVRMIGDNIFANSNLKNVYLSHTSNFVIEQESLIDQDCQMLLSYFGHDVEYEIPDCVKTINLDAFCCSEVEKVTIPASVTDIKNGSFFKCKKLKNVILPDSAITIEKEAFLLCNDIILKSNNPYVKEYAAENNIPYSIMDDSSWL